MAAVDLAGWFSLIGAAAEWAGDHGGEAAGLLEDNAARQSLLRIVKNPVIPSCSSLASVHHDPDSAQAALRSDRLTTFDFFLDAAGRRDLDRLLPQLRQRYGGAWQELSSMDERALYELVESALTSTAFRRLTGFDPGRDEFSVTLSIQDLDRSGIPWHRDLYWPGEWVGENVLAIFHALDDDNERRGGALVYYAASSNRVRHLFRRRHETTIIWNPPSDAARPLHAVSRFTSRDTSRHLLVVQCKTAAVRP